MDKKEEKKELNLSSTLNSESNDSDNTQSIHGKYSLIHTDLIENITENSLKYIIISCCLIIPKEMLIKIIFSTNDVFDYYFLNIIIITLILKFYLKANIYRHRLFAVTFVTTISGVCLISCLFVHNLNDLVKGNYIKILIAIFLYFIFNFLFCIGIIIQKNIMENKFISPYKIIVFKGIIGTIFSIICIIISSLWICDDKDILTDKNFKLFVCSVKYKNEIYYDHFISYFTEFEGQKLREVLLLILYSIVHFITELCFIFINKFLSPTHYLIAESLFTLLHIPFDYLPADKINDINKEVDNYKENQDLYQDESDLIFAYYKAIICVLGSRILRFISSFFDFIGYLIYLEIIELRFCGLNRNIKKNIRKRASFDANNDNEDNSSSDSDEENEKETKKEEL